MSQGIQKMLPPPPINNQRSKGWPWTLPWWHRCQTIPPAPPKISVIIPSFNQGRFLEATLRSVLLQPYPNVECIVIDGGSTDESVEVIRYYEKHLTYWVSEKDRGQAHAINKGLTVATGELCGYLNSDDLYLPWTLARIASAAAERPQVSLIYGDRLMLDGEGEVVGWTRNAPFDHQRTSFSICSETALWRRSTQGEVGVFDEALRFAVDVDFFLRFYKKGGILHLDQALGCFRCHAGSKSMTIFNEVGAPEAARAWKKQLGCDKPSDAAPQHGSKLRHRMQLLRYPMSLAWPYLKQKAKKWKSISDS